MKILITGGAGFIGSWTVRYFLEQGHEVIVPSRLGEYKRLDPHDKLILTCGNLFDKKFIQKLIIEHQPDAVIHLAWDGVLNEGRNDKVMQKHNYDMTLNLLKCACENNVKTFIGLGSQAEYGVHNKRIDETVNAEPKNMYGHYKLQAGIEGKKQAEEYDINYAWLRLFSTFGPKDNDGYLIPYVIKSFLDDKSPELTNCDQNWDYIYVEDIPKLLERVLNCDKPYQGIYNLSSGQTRTLRQMVLIIRDLTQANVQPDFDAKEHRLEGLMHLEGDNKKFYDQFGWVTLTEIDQSLYKTVSWFKKQHEEVSQ